MVNDRVQLLLHQLDLAFHVRSWHGPNLMGALRGVGVEEATWRPQPERHNIAELAVHAAYWKYRVTRLVAADVAASFDLKGSDFFARGGPLAPATWQDDLGLLAAWHKRLKEAVAALDPARLEEPAGADHFSVAELVSGAAAHDLYHAGQIRLLRRMWGDAPG